MASVRKIEYTIDDVMNLPEGERAELINGELYLMSAPSRIHQKLSGFLHTELDNFIRRSGGDCEVYAAPFSVFLSLNKPFIKPINVPPILMSTIYILSQYL